MRQRSLVAPSFPARIARRPCPRLARGDEPLRDVLQRRGLAEAHAVARAGLAGQLAVLDEDVEAGADGGEVEVFLEAVEVDVAGVELGVGRGGGAVGLLVEGDAVLALVDAVVLAVAGGEAAARGGVGRVAAGGVGGVLLDADAQAAVFGVVVAVWAVVQRVLEEVAVELVGRVGLARFELAGCGVGEVLPACRCAGQRGVVVFWSVVSDLRGAGVLAFGGVGLDPWLLPIHAPARPFDELKSGFDWGIVSAWSLLPPRRLFSGGECKVFRIAAIIACR